MASTAPSRRMTNLQGRAPLVPVKPAPVNVEDWTTVDFLHAIANKYPEARTVYGMANRLEVTRPTIHRYLDNRGTFDATVALRVAALLPEIVDPGTLLVITSRERERQGEAREYWNGVLEKLREAGGRTAMVLALALALPYLEPVTSGTLYIMSNRGSDVLTSIPAAIAALIALLLAARRAVRELPTDSPNRAP